MADRALMTEIRPSRRTVAAAALWSVPVVAVATAAPAMAATVCSPTTYDANFTTSTFTRSSATSGTLTASAAGHDPVTVKVASTVVGGKVIGGPNLAMAGDTQVGYNGTGDLVADGLEFQQSGGSKGSTSRQSVTFTFDRPVTGLSFVIADLDRVGTTTATGTGVYQDAVAVTSSGQVQVSNGSNVIGTATMSDPLMSNRDYAANAENTAYRSGISIGGSVTTFTLHFWSGTGTAGQQVFLRDMVFTAAGCKAA